MRSKASVWCAAAAASVWMAITASAATQTLYATQDCYVRSTDGTINYNSGWLYAGSLPNPRDYITFIQFDVSAIPAGSAINSATLNLWRSVNSNNDYEFFDVHEVADPWTETGPTWNNGPSWWVSPVSQVYGGNPGTTGWLQWDVASMVDDWVNGSRTNYGFAVMMQGNFWQGLSTRIEFNSSEGATVPRLIVNYTPPATVDLYDDGEAYRSFSPQTVTRGATSFTVSTDIRNGGGSSAGAFDVDFYASTNTTISAADFLIGSAVVSSLGGGSWTTVSWSGTFPLSVPAGTYWVGWIIDAGGFVVESNESNNTAYKTGYQLTVQDPVVLETVSTPNTPSGPTSGTTGTTYSYSTGGASSNLGHSLQYAFDWGDGTFSTWSTLTSRSHSWSGAGTYNVRALARCATHTTVLSSWSLSRSVTISTASETISVPNTPTGQNNPAIGFVYTYTTTGASSNLGHSVQYQFDWGDGTGYSSWVASGSVAKSWASTGTFFVRARARCSTHTSVVSNWSSAYTVTAYDPSPPPPPPPPPPDGGCTSFAGAAGVAWLLPLALAALAVMRRRSAG